jgi:hypothetical protein
MIYLLWMILDIVILHMNHNRFNLTSCHWTFFLLEPILKYITLSLTLVNLGWTLMNLGLT